MSAANDSRPFTEEEQFTIDARLFRRSLSAFAGAGAVDETVVESAIQRFYAIFSTIQGNIVRRFQDDLSSNRKPKLNRMEAGQLRNGMKVIGELARLELFRCKQLADLQLVSMKLGLLDSDSGLLDDQNALAVAGSDITLLMSPEDRSQGGLE